MSNALAMAIDAHDCLCEMEGNLMGEIAGDAAFEPFDSALHDAVVDLVCHTAHTLDNLSPRARHARINLIWKDFIVDQKQKRILRSQMAEQAVVSAKLDGIVNIP